jgi:hypothetical protein
MIKLIDILKEIEQEQQVEEGKVGNFITGLGLTAATMLGGAKAQDKAPVDTKPGITQQIKTGTSVDGILGQFTSQFKFPGAFNITDDKRIDLGLERNKTLSTIRNFDKGKMKEWNKFVDWMKIAKIDGKEVSGNPILDKDSTIGVGVIDVYKKTPQGKGFWVKTGDDIEEVQDFIKAYRKYTIADWKLGDGTVDGGHSVITFGTQPMDPKNPEHLKRVNNNYMIWAKD